MSHIAAVIGLNGYYEFTPVISTASYVAADQFGGINEIPNVFRTIHRPLDGNASAVTPFGRQRGYVWLSSILVKNNSAAVFPVFDLFIFNQLPTITSVDNGALNFADSELSKLVCMATVDSSWIPTVSNSATEKQIQNLMIPQVSTQASSSLWIVIRIATNATFATTSDVTFALKFSQD